MSIYFTKVRDNEPYYAPNKRFEDADYDLFASTPTCIQPGEIVAVSTNIAIEFPDNIEGKIEGKSGLALKGLDILGGVIDNGFCGEIKVVIVNLGKSNYFFETGQKIAQLRLREKIRHFSFIFVDKLSKKSERGSNGWGSTGK